MIGTSLNQYQITATIGAGGMGEVFRARDTRLNRDVAVKVLPKDFVADADRLRRFEQEAKTLAALNHPNVLTIHDAGVHEGAPYLVSELLEGKTLREVLGSTANVALPVRKATEYALQIAHGLAAAHGKGVIHRDLKPENIFVTKDGRVKILDFGLAKLKQVGRGVPTAPPDGSLGTASPTIRIDADTIINTTEPGMVLGTPAYMSPEQVRGEPADHRADIFAFGCVLYEMLSGTRAFRRNTAVESMNAVLNDAPPELSTTNPNIPLALARIVERCLEKKPERRFQSADDLAFAIENAGTASTASLGSVEARKEDARFGMIKLLPWMIAALCLAGITWMFVQRQKTGGSDRTAPVAGVRRFEITLPEPPRKPASLSLIDGIQPVISPDGRKLAYANAEGLWLRWLDHAAPPVHLVAGEEIFGPCWSPSSTDLAYFDARKLCRISANGGDPTPIVTIAGDFAAPVSGVAWLSAERIIFATGMSGLFEAPAQGGRVRTVLDTDNGSGELDFHDSSPLPGSRGILFAIHRENIGVDTIGLWTPEGKRKTLLQLPGGRILNPVYSPSGHVVFERFDVAQGLWAFAFSLATLERTGEPFRVSVGGTQPSIAEDGTLVFSSNDRKVGLRQLTWVDRSGKIVGSVGRPMPGLGWPRLSPDGSRIIAASGDTLTTLDLWMFDLAGGGAIPITRQLEREDTPAWWNEGRTVLFTRFGDSGAQVFAKAADSAGPEQLLFEGSSGDLSRSGKFLLLTQQGPGGRMTSGYISLADQKKRMIQLPEEFQRVYWFRLSPDDRLLAYHSAEGGKNIEVYVVDFPAFTNKRNVSRGWGRQPEWDPTGTELFFIGNKGRTLMSARVKSSGESLEEPAKVFDLPERIYSENPWRMSVLDVAPKGDRFLMLKDVEQETATNQLAKPNVQVVQNWFEEFREKK